MTIATILEEYANTDTERAADDWVHLVCEACHPSGTRPIVTLCGGRVEPDDEIPETSENLCEMCTVIRQSHFAKHHAEHVKQWLRWS